MLFDKVSSIKKKTNYIKKYVLITLQHTYSEVREYGIGEGFIVKVCMYWYHLYSVLSSKSRTNPKSGLWA